MSDILELKITGWNYKGFKVPNININLEDPKGTRNFTLFQMFFPHKVPIISQIYT